MKLRVLLFSAMLIAPVSQADEARLEAAIAGKHRTPEWTERDR